MHEGDVGQIVEKTKMLIHEFREVSSRAYSISNLPDRWLPPMAYALKENLPTHCC